MKPQNFTTEGTMMFLRGDLIIFIFIFSISFFSANAAFGQNVKDLEAQLDSRDWNVRLAAVEKLGKMRDRKSLNLLIHVAGTRAEYWPVKIKAIQFLGETADPSALQVLLDIYNDPFLNSECPSIKSYAATALGYFKNSDPAFKALITGIDDPELLTREAVIESLGRLERREAVDILIPLLNDRIFTVRHITIRALANIRDKRAVSHLTKLAESDKDPLIREIAAMALKTF
jgi:HEAT repeat protein